MAALVSFGCGCRDCAICAWYSGSRSRIFFAFDFCVKFVDVLIKLASESTKCRAAFNCESVNTHSKSSRTRTKRDANIVQSESFFLMVIRHRASFVSKRSGVRDLSWVELASMRTVCHDNSLNINKCPCTVSFKRVTRKSPFSHFGVFDSTRMRDIWKEKRIIRGQNCPSNIEYPIIPALTLWTPDS